MDAATAGLLGVIAGGVFGLLGALVAAWSQGRSEEARWNRTRRDELDKAHREAIEDFVRKATKTTQRMHWLAWESRAPGTQPEAAFATYSAEMRDLLADLFASGAVLDMLIPQSDQRRTDGLTPVVRIVRRITAADALIGEAEIQLRSGKEWMASLTEAFDASVAVHHDLQAGYPWSSR